MSSLDARLTFRFNTFFSWKFHAAVLPSCCWHHCPVSNCSSFLLLFLHMTFRSPLFCSGFQHNTIPLSSGMSIQQNQQKTTYNFHMHNKKEVSKIYETSFLLYTYIIYSRLRKTQTILLAGTDHFHMNLFL